MYKHILLSLWTAWYVICEMLYANNAIYSTEISARLRKNNE